MSEPSLSHVVVLNWKDRTHPEAGGAETYCENVARELVRHGMNVTYVTSRPEGTAQRDARDGYEIRRLGGTYTVYLFALLWLWRHRRDIDAVIDSQNGIPFFSPLAVGRRTAVALLIHHVHQQQFALYFSPIMARVGRFLEKTATRWVYRDRSICVVSPSTRTEVRQLLRLAGPIAVTPNGYRAQTATTASRADVPTITTVGRLVPHKRWHLLIEAVADLVADEPALVVNIVGSGPELERLADLIRTRDLERHIVLRGFVSEEVRDQLLAEAWLTVSTSVGEGWGLSIIEAAAQGVPAVALDVPGLRDSVRDGVTGWLATEDSLTSTLRAALLSMRDPRAAAAIAGSCRAWADALRWSYTADRFRGVLAHEQSRLASAGRSAAHHSDTAARVTLTREGAKRFDLASLALSDQATFCTTCVPWSSGPFRIVMHGRDDQQAYGVLERLGLLPEQHVMDVSLCRSNDFIQWHGDAVPHNAVGLRIGARCPAAAAAAAAAPAQNGRRIA